MYAMPQGPHKALGRAGIIVLARIPNPPCCLEYNPRPRGEPVKWPQVYLIYIYIYICSSLSSSKAQQATADMGFKYTLGEVR